MPLMKQTAVVPFGKHKGAPIEQLAADPEYCEWLMGQSWFVEKYAHIHTLIINNFGEPSETPEHNRLQLRFLDETFRRQCTLAVLHAGQSGIGRPLHTPQQQDLDINLPQFEVHGWDVRWEVSSTGHSFPTTIFAECKPLLGDDFPAVLRQIQSAATRSMSARYIHHYGWGFLLLATEVRSQAGSLDTIKAFFAQSGVLLSTVHDIEAIQIDRSFIAITR